MIVGILSDSHGKVERVRRARSILVAAGARVLVHCGDVGGMDVFGELLGCDLRFVWGNTDVPTQGMRAYLESVGIAAPTTVPLAFELAGYGFQVFHGHEREFAAALADPQVDYILHGHTHAARHEFIGNTQVINPGALQRALTYTVATLDLDRSEVRFHKLT
jgi:putative phosphoesterase